MYEGFFFFIHFYFYSFFFFDDAIAKIIQYDRDLRKENTRKAGF